MPEQTFAKKIKFDSNCFIGEHYGYKANLGITHQRKIYLDRKTITISDRLIGKVLIKNAYINLILDPNVLVNTDEQYLRLSSSNVELITNIPTSDSIIGECYVARGYGERVKSNKIQYKINPKTEVKVQFSLV